MRQTTILTLATLCALYLILQVSAVSVGGSVGINVTVNNTQVPDCILMINETLVPGWTGPMSVNVSDTSWTDESYWMSINWSAVDWTAIQMTLANHNCTNIILPEMPPVTPPTENNNTNTTEEPMPTDRLILVNVHGDRKAISRSDLTPHAYVPPQHRATWTAQEKERISSVLHPAEPMLIGSNVRRLGG